MVSSGPRSRRSARLMMVSSSAVSATTMIVAEKISGVRNELKAACSQMPRPFIAPRYSAVTAVPNT